MTNYNPMRNLPADAVYSAGDVLVLCGELFGRGYANGIVQSFAADLTAQARNRMGGGVPIKPVDAQLRVWYNSQLKSKNYIVPGLIALILMIIGALLTSLTLAREWEMGTMEQLLSTPLRPAEVALGKMSAYFTLGVIDMLLTVVVGVFIFQVPQRGSYLFLVFTGCLFLIGALLWGILISALTRSQLLAYMLAMITSFLPAFLLSGFVFAIENMPMVLQYLTLIVPARYYIALSRAIFLKGITPLLLWTQIVALLLIALVFARVTLARSRKLGLLP